MEATAKVDVVQWLKRCSLFERETRYTSSLGSMVVTSKILEAGHCPTVGQVVEAHLCGKKDLLCH